MTASQGDRLAYWNIGWQIGISVGISEYRARLHQAPITARLPCAARQSCAARAAPVCQPPAPVQGRRAQGAGRSGLSAPVPAPVQGCRAQGAGCRGAAGFQRQCQRRPRPRSPGKSQNCLEQLLQSALAMPLPGNRPCPGSPGKSQNYLEQYHVPARFGL